MIKLDGVNGQFRSRPLEFGDSWEPTRSGLYLPARLGPDARKARYGTAPLAIDLFAGAGGFSLGFSAAGFRVIAAVEHDPACAMTYLYNLGSPEVQMHFIEPEDKQRWRRALKEQERLERREGITAEVWRPGANPAQREHLATCAHYWLGDIRKLTGGQMLDALSLEPGDIDCVAGGPPCQGFSIAGRRDVMDPRNSLVFEFARLVLELQPRTFVMENVPGIVSMVTPDGVPVLDALCRILSDGGFGSYEALKRSLLQTAGLGAVVNGGRALVDADAADDGDGPDQAALQPVLF